MRPRRPQARCPPSHQVGNSISSRAHTHTHTHTHMDTHAGRKKQQNRTQTLGLPSEQLQARTSAKRGPPPPGMRPVKIKVEGGFGLACCAPSPVSPCLSSRFVVRRSVVHAWGCTCSGQGSKGLPLVSPVRRVFASRQPCVCLRPGSYAHVRTCLGGGKHERGVCVQDMPHAAQCLRHASEELYVRHPPRLQPPRSCRRLRKTLRLVPSVRGAGMRLRTKNTKKGFYNLKTLEQLAWCKGRVCTLQQSFLPPPPPPSPPLATLTLQKRMERRPSLHSATDTRARAESREQERTRWSSSDIPHKRSRWSSSDMHFVGHRLTSTHIHCRPCGQPPPRSQAELAPEAGSRQLAPEAVSKCCACLSVRLRCCAL
jgi:hypothetical protein